MSESTQYKGKIKSFDEKERIGFVIGESGEELSFYYPNQLVLKMVKQQYVPNRPFKSGENIQYFTRPMKLTPDKTEAYNITLVENSDFVEYQQRVLDAKPLQGFLIHHENGFSVKDDKNAIVVGIELTMWETDVDKMYHDRIGKLVPYDVIHSDQKVSKWGAILTDRKLKPLYAQIQELKLKSIVIDVKIGKMQQDKRGYFVDMEALAETDFTAFLELTTAQIDNYKRGDVVGARITKITDTSVLMKPLIM